MFVMVAALKRFQKKKNVMFTICINHLKIKNQTNQNNWTWDIDIRNSLGEIARIVSETCNQWHFKLVEKCTFTSLWNEISTSFTSYFSSPFKLYWTDIFTVHLNCFSFIDMKRRKVNNFVNCRKNCWHFYNAK